MLPRLASLFHVSFRPFIARSGNAEWPMSGCYSKKTKLLDECQIRFDARLGSDEGRVPERRPDGGKGRYIVRTKAAVVREPASGFELMDLDVDDPCEDEILVRIAGVGVCHTDLVFSSGAIGYPFPAVFGHEGAGTVVKTGSKVKKVSAGDRVLMTFRSCGTCDRCDSGDPAYCRSMPSLNYTGRRVDGTCCYCADGADVASNFFGQSSFSGLALTYERNVVKVDDPDLPLSILGPLGCGIQTGAGAVLRSLKVAKGSSILISGDGSVGLSAVMAARIRECEHVILVEPLESRRELARELGATLTLAPAENRCFSEDVRAVLPYGVDYAFDTSGAPQVQTSALASLGSKGVLGLVGISPPHTKLPGEVNGLMTFGQSVRGIVEGDSDPDEFLPELLSYFKEGRLPFDRLVKTYPLSEIGRAIADQHAGLCIKPVLVP